MSYDPFTYQKEGLQKIKTLVDSENLFLPKNFVHQLTDLIDSPKQGEFCMSIAERVSYRLRKSRKNI